MPKTIPQLTDATTVNASDELIIQQGGITKRATASEMFNSSAIVTATGSTTARTLAARAADVVNVLDFGASPSASAATNRAAIQAAIDAAGSRTVYIPAGFYSVDNTITVQSTTHIKGDSRRTFLRATHSGNILVFQPPDAGSANSFLNNAELSDIYIMRSTPANGAVGTGVWIRQCNGFRANNVISVDSNACFRITGGQLNTLSDCTAFVADSTISWTSPDGLFVLEEADIGGGNYQPCYTINMTNILGSASKVLRHCIRVNAVDGLNISNAYLAFASEALVRLRRSRSGATLGSVMLSNCYLDCTDAFGGGVTGTPFGLSVDNSLGTTEYGAVAVHLSNCTIANNDDTGSFNSLISISKYVLSLNVSSCYIANSGSPYSVQINDSVASSPRGTYSFTGNTFTNVSNASGGGAIYCKDTSQVSIAGNNFKSITSSNWAILFEGTIDSASVVGNTVDGSPTDLVVFSNSITINGNVVVLNSGLPASGNQFVNLSLPTSSTGLPAGSLFSNSGIVTVKGSTVTGSATYDPPSLNDGDGATTTVTVTGAALGDYADASFSLDLQGITVTAWVSAADTVSVRFQNETGGTINLGSGTLRARILKP